MKFRNNTRSTFQRPAAAQLTAGLTALLLVVTVLSAFLFTGCGRRTAPEHRTETTAERTTAARSTAPEMTLQSRETTTAAEETSVASETAEEETSELSSASEESTAAETTAPETTKEVTVQETTIQDTAIQDATAPETSASATPDFGALGSAPTIDGRVLLISVYVCDSETSWNRFEPAADNETGHKMYEYLGAAVDWLETNTAAYGAHTEFIYDWVENSDLYYYAEIDASLVKKDSSATSYQYAYLDQNVPTDSLLKKYEADSIAYLFFFNTPVNNPVHTWTMQHNSRSRYEIINVYARYESYVTSASSMAHEILHLFGAPDMYYANSTIPQSYIDHLVSSGSKDIMYCVADVGPIWQEFTALDAYYVGLIDHCDEVDAWGLGESEY